MLLYISKKLSVIYRFPELQRQYSLQNKRSQRTTFLKNLVTAKAIADIEENQDEV